MIFVFVTFGMIIFTNARLFVADAQSVVLPVSTPQTPLTEKNIYQDNTIASVIDITDQKNKQIQQMIDQYKQTLVSSNDIAPDTQKILEENLKNYDFKFNTLPPTNRLIVPSL